MKVTNGRLAAIVGEILINPFSGEVDDQETFEQFCTEIAKVVTDYCGGEVVRGAEYLPAPDNMDWTTHYVLEVQLNESSPPGGGIWAKQHLPKRISVSTDLLTTITGMARSHVDDIESGLEDGDYSRAENEDFPAKQQAVQTAEAICAGTGDIAMPENGAALAKCFMRELLNSIETLSGIAEEHGARTLADLMYLQQAILSGGFIDHYPGESKVLDIAHGLPSGAQWAKYIKSEYLEGEVEEGGCSKAEIAEAVDANATAPGNTKSSVPVRYWDAYADPTMVNTHQLDVDDQRKTNGQIYLDLGALEGNLDDMLAVMLEVNTNPINGIDHVPCAHIHFDGDGLAVSLFKVGNKILVRPETDVTIERFTSRSTPTGPVETMYWIE